jgi:FemAB-related protein (PEP-CTERM system-associated)
MSVEVQRYAGEREAWDAFVRRSASGTLFHLIGWKEVLERSFGLTARYLVARRGAEIAGVLPLFEIGAPMMEPALLSVPFAVDGGVCAADADAQAALDAAAVVGARECGARWVELRDGREAPGFRLREPRYLRYRRPLFESEEANLAATPAKRRHMIRLGQRHGLIARTNVDDLAAFYDLHARTSRRFGTPVLPLRFFEALRQTFAQETVLMTVWRAGVPLAGALIFFFGDVVAPYYVGSRRDGFRYASNDFLYWEIMRHAAARGARRFDFGRSKIGTGAAEYKRLWGFDPEPVRYRVCQIGVEPTRDRASNDRELQWLQSTWRKLPLPLTKLLGPIFVSRYGPYFT